MNSLKIANIIIKCLYKDYDCLSFMKQNNKNINNKLKVI